MELNSNGAHLTVIFHYGNCVSVVAYYPLDLVIRCVEYRSQCVVISSKVIIQEKQETIKLGQ